MAIKKAEQLPEVKKGRGGARKGAGRKSTLPEGEKKTALFIYPRNEEIEFLGGKDAVKAMCEAHVTKVYKARQKKV